MSLPSRRSNASIGARRKTTEACNPCRGRKLKCDGLAPCKSCEKSGAQCSYDPSTSTNKVTGELDIINARVVELERAVFGERTLQPRNTTSMSDSGQISNQNLPGITMYSRDTGSLAFYGSTATLSLLASVEESDNPRPSKKQKHFGQESEAASDNSDSTPQDQIYATGDSYRKSTSTVQEAIAYAHFEYFLRVFSDTLPVLEPNTLRAAYERFWPSSQSRPGSLITRQGQCLIYSVLALGALYSKTSVKDAEWAFDYFAEAQGLIGTLFSTNSLETVQAAMLMAIYSHHTAQPTLTYNYLGIAIRMAYSIGINGSPIQTMTQVIDPQSALRTWWTLYSFESDICLEYGKPLCIRETDSKAPYPQHTSEISSDMSRFSFIVANAKFSRIVRKIIDLLSNIREKRHPLESFVGRMMNHQAELMTWRGELAAHLMPQYGPASEQRSQSGSPWVQRQCFDLELRFNHVMLILHRPFFADTTFSTPFYSSMMAKSVCLGAARETILLSHRKLVNVPSVEHWSCYYHRVLAATMLILAFGPESPLMDRKSFEDICSKGMEIFRCMSSGCPMKGIVLIENTLARMLDQSTTTNMNLGIAVSTE